MKLKSHPLIYIFGTLAGLTALSAVVMVPTLLKASATSDKNLPTSEAQQQAIVPAHSAQALRAFLQKNQAANAEFNPAGLQRLAAVARYEGLFCKRPDRAWVDHLERQTLVMRLDCDQGIQHVIKLMPNDSIFAYRHYGRW